MQAMLRKHLTIVCRHLPLPHLVVSIPAEHQPKEAEAVGWIDFDGPGNILLQEQPALVWAPDGKSFALPRAIRNNLAHNADMSAITLTNAEFTARGELWKVDLADK